MRRILAAVLAGCILFTASEAMAKPGGAEAKSGQAYIVTAESSLTWQREGVVQQSEAAFVLPRGLRLCSGWQYEVSRSTPADVRQRRMRRLILCAFTLEGIPNQVLTAWYVADRESNYEPWAYNPSGASGLFQHISGYWAGRRMLLPLAQFPNRAHVSPFNARANAWVTAIMVRGSGWGPWGM